MKKVCRFLPRVCQAKYLTTDVHPRLISTKTIPKFEAQGSSGSSWKCFLHFAQNIRCWTKKRPCFRKFDFGKKKNMEKYGQKIPPMYDLDLVKERIRLFSGSGDRLAPDLDGQVDKKLLRNADVELEVMKKWGHMTFILGKGNTVFYNRIADDLVKSLE